MLRRAPDRTVDERRSALEEANRVRFARAATKRDLKSGDLDIYDLLMDPSEELRGAKVEEMLLAMKGMGRIKVTRVLREAGISRSKTLVGLTHGQRDRLLGAPGGEAAAPARAPPRGRRQTPLEPPRRPDARAAGPTTRGARVRGRLIVVSGPSGA